jgi:hypothetical protein
VLTLNFTLAVKTPVKAKELKFDIYDPTIFIDFEFDKKDPGKLVGGPQCKMDVVYPREMTFAEGKALSDIPADQPNVSMAWGEKFRHDRGRRPQLRRPHRQGEAGTRHDPLALDRDRRGRGDRRLRRRVADRLYGQ